MLKLAHVYNNTIYGGMQGIRFAAQPREEGRVVGNLVFADTPISSCCTLAANTGNVTDAIANAGDPVSVILGWARGLGFDGVTYFASVDAPSVPLQAASWSTWDERWQQAYRDSGYASVDPRLVATAGQSLPCLWDGVMIVARGFLRRFLDVVARAGVRTGVAIPIGTARGRAIVALDSED